MYIGNFDPPHFFESCVFKPTTKARVCAVLDGTARSVRSGKVLIANERAIEVPWSILGWIDGRMDVEPKQTKTKTSNIMAR